MIAVSGDLDLYTSPSLRTNLHEVGDGKIALDLTDVTFMDSSGLGAVVGALKHVRGGEAGSGARAAAARRGRPRGRAARAAGAGGAARARARGAGARARAGGRGRGRGRAGGRAGAGGRRFTGRRPRAR